jgi:hypothetical protein
VNVNSYLLFVDMNKKKLQKISRVLSIFKSLNGDDLDFFCLNANNESIQIFLEVVYNLISNESLFERVENKVLFESVRNAMKNNKKKWCSIIKSRNNKSKVNFIRKQIGSGVLDDICMLIIPIILTLL